MKATLISRFTPSLMSPDDLEAVFVQREELAKRIVELTQESALSGSKHHTLLIGPRGIGKTHLAAIVYHRVRAMDDFRDKLAIAWLREEEWGVTSFLDLLLRVLRALVDKDNGLAEGVESLYQLDADQAEGMAAGLLKDFVLDRTLFLIVENLDDLFDGLGDEGQRRLRAYLQENPFCTILATAQSLFNGVSLQTSPFYGFFRVQHLGQLSFDEGRELLRKIATLHGDDELASFIESPKGRARVRALHHLAGGNHRVYVIFSDFVTRQSLDELVDPVLRTLDDLTPYYQARMSRLSPQQRKIVELLCDRRGAVPVKEIAERCFASHQTASSQLATLRELGYVQSEPVGRESYYELREVLMRLCMEVKKQRGGPVRLLVDFLRLWYSRAEIEERLSLLQPGAEMERECLFQAIHLLEQQPEDPRVAACKKDFFASFSKGDYVRSLEAAEEWTEIAPSAQGWSGKGLSLMMVGRHDEALASTQRALELEPRDPKTLLARAGALWGAGRLEETLACLQQAIELEPNLSVLRCSHALPLLALRRFDEALSSLDKAISLDPAFPPAWERRGLALMALGRYQDALSSFDRASELGVESPDVLFGRAHCLVALERYREGMAALDVALSQVVDKPSGAISYTAKLLKRICLGASDPAAHVGELIRLYEKHGVLRALAVPLAASTYWVVSQRASDGASRAWRNAWQKEGTGRQELEMPLRLLDAAVRYREAKDPRILLGLPAEERKLLESLIEPAEAAESS